jgi:hypothetical protein
LRPTFLEIRLRSFPLGSDAGGVKIIWHFQIWSIAFRKLFFRAPVCDEKFFQQEARRGRF